MALPQSFLQELKYRCEIGDVVSSYVNVKRRGKNLTGLCPFHNEKTPSFTVYPTNGSFYCFGCGTGGDVITFIMKIENLDYIEAVKYLASRAGIQMPSEDVDESGLRLKTRILEINRATAKFYHNALMTGEEKAGIEYFQSRNLSKSMIVRFGLGYAPRGGFKLVNHLKSLGYKDDEMILANVAFKTRTDKVMDRFYERVMFPIIDLRGNVIAFGGRALLPDAKPKYINTSDTPVYKKSRGLFAMNFAKSSDGEQIILAEGYMDVIALHSIGFTNTVASLGTALTPEQAKIISNYAKEVIICYDSDEAGQKAAKRAIPIFRESGINVKVLSVPGNKDPDEFIKNAGENAQAKFKALISACDSDIEYRLQNLSKEIKHDGDEGRIEYVTAACGILASIENEIECDVYIGKLALETSVGKDAILSQVKKLRSKNAKKEQNKWEKKEQRILSGLEDRINLQKPANLRLANAEEAVVSYIFANPGDYKTIADILNYENMCTDFNKSIYKALLDICQANELTGSLNLTDLSEKFTTDELSAVARLLAKFDVARVSREDAVKFAKLIVRESGFSNPQNIKEADDEALRAYLLKLKENKK